MPTGNEVEVTFCLTDGTKLTRIEDLADITTFLEQHEEYVKIVRCKECKYNLDGHCDYWSGWEVVSGDDFCSRGERHDT